MHADAELSILSLMAVKNEGRRAGCKLLLMAKVKVQSERCALAGVWPARRTEKIS